MYAALSSGTLLRSVISQQYKCVMQCRRHGGGGGGAGGGANSPPMIFDFILFYFILFHLFWLVSSAVSHDHDDNTPTHYDNLSDKFLKSEKKVSESPPPPPPKQIPWRRPWCNGTGPKFDKKILFHENVSSRTFIFKYVTPKMIVYAFRTELDQPDYWYPRKKKKIWKFSYKINGELFSCGISDSGRVPSREGGIQNFISLVLLNGLSKFAQNFIVRFLKLLSTHPIHIVVWGNFPFNCWVPIMKTGLLFYKYVRNLQRWWPTYYSKHIVQSVENYITVNITTCMNYLLKTAECFNCQATPLSKKLATCSIALFYIVSVTMQPIDH